MMSTSTVTILRILILIVSLQTITHVFASLTWVELTDVVMPTGLYVTCNGYDPDRNSVWLIGGRYHAGSKYESGKQVIEYNIVNQQFTTHPNIPHAVTCAGRTTIHNTIYMVLPEVSDWIVSFNMTSAIYNSNAISKTSGLRNACLTPFDNQYLLMLGGKDDTTSHASFQIYDLYQTQWITNGPSMITARHGFGCTVHKERLYIVGGWSTDNVALDSVDVIDVLSIQNAEFSSWTRLDAALTTGTGNVAIVIHNDLIYSIGGYYHPSCGTKNEVDVIDTTTGSISLDSYLSTQMSHPAIHVVDLNNIPTILMLGGLINNCKVTNKLQYAVLPTYGPTGSPTFVPSTNPTDGPTQDPTSAPSANPTEGPTQDPTSIPSANPTYAMFDIKYQNQMRCDDLANNIDIQYGINKQDCVGTCQQMGMSCRMINYFTFFKTTNDSRCYMFDDVCDIKVVSNDNNQSSIAYTVLDSECDNYPSDWTDYAGDSCPYYESFNWCDKGNLLRPEDDYYNLISTKYRLSAIESCCECGGGVNTVDNVVLSYDKNWDNSDDVLCSWVENPFTRSLETNQTLRKWDNLVLYQFCDNLDDIDCEYLINTDFASIDYDYTLYLCHGEELNADDNQFIFNVLISDFAYDTYINLMWFDIDGSRYSSDININHANVTQCSELITDFVIRNETYRYGVHPCYVLDTVHPTVVTLHPSRDPTTSPSKQPTLNPSQSPTVVTGYPSRYPTTSPSKEPTLNPSKHPTTLAPTNQPTAPTDDPSHAPTDTPDPRVSAFETTVLKSANTPQNQSASGLMTTVIILSCVLGLSCCVIALILGYIWRTSKNNDDNMGQEIGMQQRTMDEDTEGNGYPELDNAHPIHKPSAPALCDDNVEKNTAAYSDL
eukprot:952613_1